MHSHPQHRRKFLQLGLTGMFTALLASVPRLGMAQAAGGGKGLIVQPGEGIRILTGRLKAPMNIMISKAHNGIDSISFCMEDIIPGRKLKIHKHLDHDELIFIHKGEGRFTLGEETVAVKTGAVVFVPRGQWHGLENTGTENISMVFQYSPAGFEQYFIENGTIEGTPAVERTPEQYAMTEKKYGMVYREPRN